MSVLQNSIQDSSRAVMIMILAALGILLATAAACSPGHNTKNEPTGSQSNVLVLRGGTIFDSHRRLMLSDQTIIIRGERIEQVGPSRSVATLPRGAQILDARGKFIIPGLIDAHVHIVHQLNDAHLTGEEVLPMFIAAGVTTIRDVGDPVVPQKLIARYAEAHADSCPRVFMCSPLIDGDPAYHRDIGWSLTDPAAVPAFVEDMSKWGVTTLKIYVGTGRNVGRRVIEEGHKRGVLVTAHLDLYSAQDAVADGIDCLEHIWSVFNFIIPEEVRDSSGHRAMLDLTNPLAQSLIADLAKRRVMVDPTLSVFRNMILLNDLETVNQHPDNAHAPARLREHWEKYRRRANLDPTTRDQRRREFMKYQELTGLLFRAGVPILAGTDTPEPYVPPGFSLLQELELLVEAGLPPSAALQAATINNAAALKQESQLGSIEPGKLADLVILSADPTADIRNARRIEKVIRGGNICDPQQRLKPAPLPSEAL
ncbi:MAG: amidohydrolase family protein [Tepidisphaeraceae bacterium]